MSEGVTSELIAAAQNRKEMIAFIEAFARVNVDVIRTRLFVPAAEATDAERLIDPDWSDGEALSESGVPVLAVDEAAKAGTKYLHIDVAMDRRGHPATGLFLGLTGLSDKLRKSLFPILSTRGRTDRGAVAAEVRRLNAWLDWVRRDDFDPAAFITYQAGIKTHGQTQNLTGAIGATGAAIAFVDAIRATDPDAIVDHAGPMSPASVRSPTDIFEWRRSTPDPTLKALLLANGRALVFASSKDANIFQSLKQPFTSAEEALAAYNAV